MEDSLFAVVAVLAVGETSSSFFFCFFSVFLFRLFLVLFLFLRESGVFFVFQCPRFVFNAGRISLCGELFFLSYIFLVLCEG